MYLIMKKMKCIQLSEKFESWKINDTLNHINMNTHNSDHVVIIFRLDFDNSVLFSDLHSSLIFLKHQMMIISTISKWEQFADKCVADKTSTLQVKILANDMSLEKIITILELVYLIFKFDIQTSDFWLHSINQFLSAFY